MDAGNTAWMLAATALVLFMTPGLAFFYGGMVRGKNVLGMLMQNFFAMGLLAVLWVAIVFSLAFGDAGNGGFIGNFDYVWLKDVGPALTDQEFLSFLTIPFVLFCAYQMTFAIITPALITGATADRLKFGAYAVFIGVWLVLVYAPVAHMVFAGGWLADMGALDFAGGAVVHMNAGAAALALVLLIGKRKGYPDTPMPPHNLPLTLLGTGILWFGWAGFNAGSALAANGIAAQAIMNTFLAASAAMLGWLLVERIRDGHATTLGAASGAVAGLVAITPCAGFVGGMAPVYIGLIAGRRVLPGARHQEGVRVRRQPRRRRRPPGRRPRRLAPARLLRRRRHQPGGRQRGRVPRRRRRPAVATRSSPRSSRSPTRSWSALSSARSSTLTIGLRVDEDAEDEGLDLTQHAEVAYAD